MSLVFLTFLDSPIKSENDGNGNKLTIPRQ